MDLMEWSPTAAPAVSGTPDIFSSNFNNRLKYGQQTKPSFPLTRSTFRMENRLGRRKPLFTPLPLPKTAGRRSTIFDRVHQVTERPGSSLFNPLPQVRHGRWTSLINPLPPPINGRRGTLFDPIPQGTEQLRTSLFNPVPQITETPSRHTTRHSPSRRVSTVTDTSSAPQSPRTPQGREISTLRVPGAWFETPVVKSQPNTHDLTTSTRSLKRRFDHINDEEQLTELHVPGEWPIPDNVSDILYNNDHPLTIARIAQRTAQFKRRCIDVTNSIARPTAHMVSGTSRRAFGVVAGTTKMTMHAIIRAYNATKRFKSHVNNRLREAMSRDRRESTVNEVELPVELSEAPIEQPSVPVRRRVPVRRPTRTMAWLFAELNRLHESTSARVDEGAEEDSTILSSTVPEDITLQTHLSEEEDEEVRRGVTFGGPYIDASWFDDIDPAALPASTEPDSPVKINPAVLARRELRLQKRLEEEKRLAEENRRAAFKPLTQEQVDQVNGVLGRGFGDFKPQDLARVVPTGRGGTTEGWLNDEVINAYLNIVTQGGNEGLVATKKKYHAFNSFFYKNIIAKGYEGVARWAKRARMEPQHIMNMQAIYAPVNSGNHWTLLVIRPAAKTVQYYDSMNGSGQRAMSAAKVWLSGELKALYKESEWTFETSTPSPQQDNYSDCGVFTITTAKLLTLGIDPLSYGPADIPMQRKRIIWELQQGVLS